MKISKLACLASALFMLFGAACNESADAGETGGGDGLAASPEGEKSADAEVALAKARARLNETTGVDPESVDRSGGGETNLSCGSEGECSACCHFIHCCVRCGNGPWVCD